MLSTALNFFIGTAAAQSTTSSVDLASLPPILQYAVAAGFAIASAVAVIFGIKAKQQSPASSDRTALEKYFDNPLTLAECKLAREEIRLGGAETREKLRALDVKIQDLREAMFQLATAVGDKLSADLSTTRHGLKNDIQSLGQLVENEAAKNRELTRRQEELQINSRRITEGNLLAAILGASKEAREDREELRERIQENKGLLSVLEDRLRRSKP